MSFWARVASVRVSVQLLLVGHITLQLLQVTLSVLQLLRVRPYFSAFQLLMIGYLL